MRLRKKYGEFTFIPDKVRKVIFKILSIKKKEKRMNR